MSDEYQMRKDIDALTQNINQIRSELIDIGLIDANATAQQISDVMGNVFSLKNDLDDFNTTLNTFESSLDNFDVQLNGDATHTGFVDYLDTLKTYIYGGDDYDYLHPSSTSLKGVLDNLQTQIGQIISGDQQLSIDLGELGGYLDGFSGTLEQFKDELEEQGIDLTNMNEGLINLIYRVNYTKNEVDNHQSDLEDFQDDLSDFSDMIGSPTDTSSDNTVYGILNDTSSSAVDLTKTLYSGASGTGTKTNPANDTVIKNLNTTTTQTSTISSKIGTVPSGQTLQGQITTIDGKVGDVSDSYDDGDNTVYGKLNDNIGLTDDLNGQINDTNGIADTVSSHTSSIDDLEDGVGGLESSLDKYHLPSSNFDWIYVFNGTLNVEDILTLESNYDIPLISYAYRLSDKQWYVRTSNTFVTTSTPTDNGVGACATIPSGSVSGTSLSFYTYELSTRKYYVYTSSRWVEKTDLADFFNQTEMFNSINDDFTSQTDFDVLDGQINDTDGIADTVSSLDSTVGNNSSGLVKQVNDNTSAIGDNTSGLIKDVNDNAENIGIVDNGLNTLIQPQTTATYVYISESVPSIQDILIAEEDYGLGANSIEYAIRTESTIKYYERNGNTLTELYNLSDFPSGLNYVAVSPLIRGTELTTGLIPIVPFSIYYDLAYKKYWGVYVDPSISRLGYYGEWIELEKAPDFFDNTLLYEAIDNEFASASHTHTKSNITDFSHTHTSSDITGLTASKNVVTGSNGKLTTENKPSIPSASTTTPSADTTSGNYGSGTTWARADHTHPKSTIYAESSHTHTISDITDGGLTTYTVGASDYDSTNLTTCAMTFNKQGSIVTCIYHLVTVSFNNKTDHTVLATGKIPSEYRPSNTFYQNVCTYNGDKLDGLLTINTNGSMYIRMGTANTSMNIYGSLTYIV